MKINAQVTILLRVIMKVLWSCVFLGMLFNADVAITQGENAITPSVV
jgi:hypothetical protein